MDNQDNVELKPEYVKQIIDVRDRVHALLIKKTGIKFARQMLCQTQHLMRNIKEFKDATCIREFGNISPDVLGSLAVARYRILNSVSDYELVNLVARAICEIEIEEHRVTDALFEATMYFYTQKRFMKLLRLMCIEHKLNRRLKTHPASTTILARKDYILEQKNILFSVDGDERDRSFFAKLAM